MTATSRPNTALVLLAHGSQDARWRRPFEQLLERLVQSGGARGNLALAYLQFCEPTLDQVLARFGAAGLEDALVIPLFMSGGGHLLRDVPDAVEQAGRRVGLRVRTAGAIAEEPEVVEAMVEAIVRLAGA